MRNVLLLVLVSAVGCAKPAAPTADTQPQSKAGDGPLPAVGLGIPMNLTGKYLALGDSYTIGEGVPTSDRWPVQLAAAMRMKGTDLGEPVIIAKTGWRTDDLSRALDSAKPAGPYELVTLLIGVNNQYQGRSAADYRPEFIELLKRSIGYAGGRAERVIVLSIPDYGVTPSGKRMDPAKIAKELDEFNAVNREEAKKAGVRYVEITAASRKQAADPAMLAADGLHPSGLMYKSWVEAALPEAEAALGAKKE